VEYVCKVGTPSGEIVERSFAATDEKALRSDLEQQGYYLFSIKRGFGWGEFNLRRRRRVPTQKLLLFAQELAALLKAGLPLLQALEIMLERQSDVAFKASLTAVRDRVRSGASISEAFQVEGDLYPPIFAATLVAGERSGSLEDVLRRLSQYLRLSETLKKKAISASIYPVLLMTVMGGLVTILLVFVIPNFQSFFEGMDVKLPFVTRTLIGISAVLGEHLGLLSLSIAAAVVVSTLWWRRAGSDETVDRLLMRVPYLGPLMRMYAISQLTRTLSTLLSGGLPLVNALSVAASSVGNRAMGAGLLDSTTAIREGKSLTVALDMSGMVDNLTLEMVKVGEQTGALSEMLSSIAEFYDEEMDAKIATILALFEPILLILMAVIVAGMLLAFYLPLFQAVSAIGAR
jgi:type IV pilus assembly protein PilC